MLTAEMDRTSVTTEQVCPDRRKIGWTYAPRFNPGGCSVDPRATQRMSKPANVQQPEDLEQHWNNNRPASDAERPGEQACNNAGNKASFASELRSRSSFQPRCDRTGRIAPKDW
jgi:hypothetical protein